MASAHFWIYPCSNIDLHSYSHTLLQERNPSLVRVSDPSNPTVIVNSLAGICARYFVSMHGKQHSTLFPSYRVSTAVCIHLCMHRRRQIADSTRVRLRLLFASLCTHEVIECTHDFGLLFLRPHGGGGMKYETSIAYVRITTTNIATELL
jgi:hypothetical protein